MTLTVRSATVTGATTKGSALTHAEMDANWAHVIQASNSTFTPSGTAGTTRTVSDRLNVVAASGDYALTANYTSRAAALTETLGIHAADVTGVLMRLGTAATSTENFRIKLNTYGNVAPYNIIMGGQSFSGTFDDVLIIGYNTANAGAKDVSSEILWKWQLESNFYDNVNLTNACEMNLDFTSADGNSSCRPMYCSLDRTNSMAWGAWSFRIGESTDGFSYFSVLSHDTTVEFLKVLPGTGIRMSIAASEKLRLQDRSANDIFWITATGTLQTFEDINLTRASPGAALTWTDNARLIVSSGKTFKISADGGSTQHFQLTSSGLTIGAIDLTTAHDLILSRSDVAPAVTASGTNFGIRFFANGTGSFTFGSTGTSSSSGATANIKFASSLLTASAGATLTASNLIPAGALVLGVTTRITTGLGTSNGTTGYAVGDGTDPNRWGDIVGTTSGTTSNNSNATADFHGAFTAANNVVLTAAGGNFDGTGAIRVVVMYLNTTAPTS